MQGCNHLSRPNRTQYQQRQLVLLFCISVSAFARFLGRSLITGKESKNCQPLFFLLKPVGLAAEGQNAQAHIPVALPWILAGTSPRSG